MLITHPLAAAGTDKFNPEPPVTDFSLPVCDNNHLAISKVQYCNLAAFVL
jgi:hypothetical protein